MIIGRLRQEVFIEYLWGHGKYNIIQELHVDNRMVILHHKHNLLESTMWTRLNGN